MKAGERLIFLDAENKPVYGRIVNVANGHATVVSFYVTSNGTIKERRHQIKDEPYARYEGAKKDDIAHQALMLANATKK